MAGADWVDEENDLIVADYFAMLNDELAGLHYNKAARNRLLQSVLPKRGRSSIEFKHQNISAVLIALGQQWIVGYKPKVKRQGALEDAVLRWLDMHPSWGIPEVRPAAGHSSAHEGDQPLWIGPSPAQSNSPPLVDVGFMASIAKKYDVAMRDAQNRALGRAGEERVLAHERASLRAAGRGDLAAKIRWTSVEDGDGSGFDILSFETNGRERLLEVKTTNGWERTPFHISRNELAVANDNRDTWHLVRLWNFVREPRAFALRPPLEAHMSLTPTSFLASLH